MKKPAGDIAYLGTFASCLDNQLCSTLKAREKMLQQKVIDREGNRQHRQDFQIWLKLNLKIIFAHNRK